MICFTTVGQLQQTFAISHRSVIPYSHRISQLHTLSECATTIQGEHN